MSGVTWPAPALADLVVFALVFGPPLLLGIPAVMRNVRQPAELAVELADADLGAAQRRWFGRLDPRFATLGYRPAATFRVTNFPHQRALARLYASPADPALAAACALVDEREGVRNGARWLTFSTRFADDGLVATANFRRTPIRRRFAGPGQHDAPAVEDPVKLHARHVRDRAAAMPRGPVFRRPEEALDAFREGYLRELAWAQRIGWSRRLPDGSMAPTLRGAILLGIDGLLPYGGAIGLGRMLFGLGAGALLSALSSTDVAVAALGSWLFSAATGVVAGAVAVALLLPGRATFWAPIAVWCGARLAEPGLGEADFGTIAALVVGATIVATRASNLAARLADRTR